MYDAETRGIIVSVKPQYLDDQSDPSKPRYVWAYTVDIENNGGETVQLQTRHWKITDAQGHVQEVQGAGVVGEQPILHPGDKFRYTSGCPLTTPSGFMTGTYQMRSESGEMFDVEIPMFSLDSPFQERKLN